MIIPNYDNGTIDVHLDPVYLGKCKKLASVFDKTTTEQQEGWGPIGSYGGGYGNTPKDNNNVERTGAIGEKAFSLLTGLPMNEDFKPNGDDGFDFKVPSFSIDVKCHTRHPNQAVEWGFNGEFFTKAHAVSGSYVPPRADILIFSAVIAGDKLKDDSGDDWEDTSVDSKNSNNIVVRFFGAISSKKVFTDIKGRLGSPLQSGGPKALAGNFKNFYIKREELIPMIDFLSRYKDELLTTKSGVII